ncbi:hypothetical protein [Streptomyces sp. NPDC091268]|uniref:hypothetical protein n=1 Tax=Streptomyces sp. NPDC091268 TaxID=3365979 RepID=UPI0038204E06
MQAAAAAALPGYRGGGEAEGPAGVLVGGFPTLEVTASAYAICVDSAALPGYQLIHLGSADVPNGGSRQVVCPAGKVLVGGGAETLGSSASLRLAAPRCASLRFSVAPRPKGTECLRTATGRSLSGSTVGLTVDAICANPVAGYNAAIVTSTVPEYSAAGYGWTAAVREPSRPSAIHGVSAVCVNFAWPCGSPVRVRAPPPIPAAVRECAILSGRTERIAPLR